MSLQAFFKPRGLVVAGSASPGKLGHILIKRIVSAGYRQVYAVNPKAMGVDEVAGFVSACDIHKELDLAVIVSPAATVCDVLEDCGKAGIRAAIIITSGFAEVGRTDLELKLKQTAERYGIRYCGPNCAGMVNTAFDLYPTLEAAPPKGSVALISQSGAVGGLVMSLAAENGLGISKFVSYGNGYDLGELDFLRYLEDDDETSVIAMYLENIKDGRTFMRELSQVTKKKPVVIVKSGRSVGGQRATLSHTGSLAGADAVYDAAFKQAGALRAASIDEMFYYCKALSVLPQLSGRRFAVVTNSGGPGVMSIDRAEELGFTIQEPSDALKDQMAEFLPPHASFKNPVDLTVEGSGEQYRLATEAVLSEADLALAIYVGTPYLEAMPVAEGLAAAARQAQKPVAAVMRVGSDIEAARAHLEANGVACFPSGEAAAAALAASAAYGAYLQGKVEAPASEPAKGKLAKRILSEAEAMELFAKEGIGVLPHYLVKDADAAAQKAFDLGFPVVMKVVSPDIIHKSGAGGVILGVVDEASARAAFERLRQVAKGRQFDGVLIYPQVKAAHEVIVGVNRDRQFGPVVVCGIGGIYAEIIRDVALRVAPVTALEAKSMLRSLKAYPLLAGARGQLAVDEEALADLIARFSQLPFIYPDLLEAEINPLFVTEDGVFAADARIIGEEDK